MSHKLKNIWSKILHPSSVELIIFYVVFLFSIISSIIVIVNNLFSYWYGILLILVSILMLIYSVYLTTIFYKYTKSKIKVKLQGNGFFSFITNYNFRTMASATFVFTINAVYTIFLGSLSIMSRSLWYGALTIYYLFLSINRGSLVLRYSSIYNQKLSHIETQLRKSKAYRNCGILLLLLTLALGAFIIEMLISPQVFPQANILIYPVAIYTIYKIPSAIFNLFKAKKHDDIIVQSIRNINLATAIVTLLTLQINIFQVLLPNKNMTTYNAISGSLTFIMLVSLGVYMIVNGNNKINNFNVITTNKKD